MRQRKSHWKICALCLAAALLLSGCNINESAPDELPVSSATPPPLAGDDNGTFRAALYFKTEDGLRLAAEQREILRENRQSYAEAAVRALCDGPQSGSLQGVIPAGLEVSRVELAGNVCNVYLEGRMPQNDTQFLAARAAIAATVSQNEGIQYVDIFVNGIQPGYMGRPLGVAQQPEEMLDTYLANLKQSIAGVEESEVTPFDSRLVAFYFSDSAKEHLLCDVRTVAYDRSADLTVVLQTVIEELMAGPLESQGRESALPADMRLTKQEDGRDAIAYQQEIPLAAQDAATPAELLWQSDLPQGQQIIELYFNTPADDFDETLAFGSIVYTVTGFCPNIGGVRIYLGDQAASPDQVGSNAPTGRDYFTREDFQRQIGHTVALSFPELDGTGLHTVLRCMRQDEAYDPLKRVQELFTGSADPGVAYPGFAQEDILGVYLQGDMAVVNWKAGFLEKLRATVESNATLLPENTREQMILYGVINTLTNFPGIQRVWMLEDGQRIADSAKRIYLGNPLLRDPGLMLD